MAPFVEDLIYGGIQPADEEGCHRGYVINGQALGITLFKAKDVGAGGIPVLLKGEDEGDVDIDAALYQLFDGGDPLGRGWNLDHDVGPCEGGV